MVFRPQLLNNKSGQISCLPVISLFSIVMWIHHSTYCLVIMLRFAKSIPFLIHMTSTYGQIHWRSLRSYPEPDGSQSLALILQSSCMTRNRHTTIAECYLDNMSLADRTEDSWFLVHLSVSSQTGCTYEGRYYQKVSAGKDFLSFSDKIQW